MKPQLSAALLLVAIGQSSALAGAPGFDDEAPASEHAGNSGIVENDAIAADEPAVSPADPEAQPYGFSINYEARYSAFGGEVILSLTPSDTPGEFTVSAETKPRGIAALVAKRSVETARFTYADGRIRSRSYELDDGTDEGSNNSTVRFDWDAGTASSVYEQTDATLPLDGDVYDRITSDVVSILDLRNGRDPRNFSIAEKNQVRPYEFTYQGEETITIPAGTFTALKYQRQRVGSSRSVMIWYAREAGYLPLRIEQLKRGKTQVRSYALSYTLANPQVAATPGTEN